MKNLEQVESWPPCIGQRVVIYRHEAIAAARLDIDAARAEGYRQGVEDAKSIGFLRLANSSIQIAKKYGAKIRHARNQAEVSRLENHVFREVGNYEMFAKAVFGSARGVKRAEIRQRLERMEKSNG